MFKTSLTTCKIQIKVQILKNLILKHLLMYCMIRTVLRYDTIHMICTLYRTIHEHLRYVNKIQNFLHTIQYISYDTYCVSYNIDNYGLFQFILCVILCPCIQGKTILYEFNQLHQQFYCILFFRMQ